MYVSITVPMVVEVDIPSLPLEDGYIAAVLALKNQGEMSLIAAKRSIDKLLEEGYLKRSFGGGLVAVNHI